MRHLMLSSALALLAGLPLTAQADDAALILGTERYEALGRLPRAANVTAAERGLFGLGYVVISLPNGRADAVAEALDAFMDEATGAERLIVALSGRFVTDGTRTWYLTAEATEPRLMGLDQTAVSVESLLQVLARAPGRAVLLLGSDPSQSRVFDPWLREGVGTLDVPQGVTVLQGDPRYIADFMGRELATPRGDLAALVAANGRVRAEGFLPRGLVLMPDPEPVVLPTPTPVVPNVPSTLDTSTEVALWEGAVALDTIDAYRNYLRRYPQGRFADQAETAIADIVAEPNRAARLGEEALGLTRDQRRAIQRALTLLDYNTRGVDGIFGPGTRGAITNWQQQNGFSQTSYLTAEQISRLDAQAARRSAEIAAAEERARLEEVRLDRAYWDETGARRDEAGYRAYLARYPQGVYAENATAALAQIEADKRQAAQAEDRAAWDAARAADTEQAYRRYLRAYPQGQFNAEASERLVALTGGVNDFAPADQEDPAADRTAERAAARLQEQQLGLNDVTSRLIEQRLAQLGLDPGPIDGRFTPDTRRALRQFQRGRDLPVTGFLSEQTVMRLLADVLGNN